MGLLFNDPKITVTKSPDDYQVYSTDTDLDGRFDELSAQVENDLIGKGHKVPDTKQPFTVEYIVKVLKEEYDQDCFATGSRVFGCSTSESDFDIVLPTTKCDYSTLQALGETYGSFVCEDSQYHNGCKLYFGHFNKKCINLIPLSVHDYLYWMLATHSIANMSRINPKGISNKTVRVSTFEMMKSLARLIVGNEVTLATVDKYREMLKKDENIVISKWQYDSSKKKENKNEK